ncbi:2Fe-2S iron-sulfur cluster-binding protein [Halomonas sp. NPDC076908]|uniref:2Fe-2S iron-sulfur cluster-binding protein n=1 Tax=Halomonas sp. NPDC076908 TaxID=3390567 RepID=UPI003CFFC9FE
MPSLTFIQPNGERVQVEAPQGQSVMEAAVKNGVTGIVAECGGACSCATCHGYIDPSWLQEVGAPSEDELDMLEFANEAKENSRLCCQVVMTEALDGMVIQIPSSQG